MSPGCAAAAKGVAQEKRGGPSTLQQLPSLRGGRRVVGVGNSLARTPGGDVPHESFSGAGCFTGKVPVERRLDFGGVFGEEVLQEALGLLALAAGGFHQTA